MPRSTDLPDDLKSLVSRQAVEVSHDRFAADSERLIGAIERALGRSIKPFHRWKQWAGLSAVVIALVVAAIFLYNGGRRPVLQPTPAPSVSPIAVATSAATPAVTPGQPPSDVFGDLSATATMTTALFVPALGLRIAFITLQQSQSMLGAMPPGALVMEVESNGAAGKAGINAGDVVEAIGSQKIDTLDDMRKSFRELGPGKTQFTIRRSDARKTVLVDCPNC
jgi:membrane-associated protease RseP (regulator of RpoE activity)